MREGIYTAGYLGVGPSVREFIVATHGYSDDAARVPGAILGGAFACLLSQCVCTASASQTYRSDLFAPERLTDCACNSAVVRLTRAKPACKVT